jgi:hypothetical protein
MTNEVAWHAVDVSGEIPPIRFNGGVPRSGEFLILELDKKEVHARVSAVEWRLSTEERLSCATIYYTKRTEKQYG